ncbi:histidine--tRNA ligase [Candidatus Woesearchaeota archaeon]|nr:histidine--tRNA ligase [Candidatus Woesearchaeota archaeon]
MVFQKPAGTRDFYPEEMDARNRVLANLKSTCKRYGFLEIEVPIIENLSLLTAKAGEEIKQQTFNLEKKGNEELALRPEFTASVARMFIEKQKVLQKPVGWFCFGSCFRYERPQKGRLREFSQLNAEIYGSNSSLADAEIISLGIDCLLSLGLTKNDFVVKINSRSLLESLLKELKINNTDGVFRIIDKKLKISFEDFKKELKKAKLNDSQIKKLIKLLDEKDISKLKNTEELKQLFNYLKKLGKKDFIEFDLSITRGLAYYTGTVFECFDRKGKLRSIFAGGRYDKMIEQLGGQSTPATGFALGDATLQLLLEDRNLLPKAGLKIDYFIAPMNEKCIPFALEVLNKIREKSSADIDLMQRKIGKQLEFASNIGAKKAVIIGDDEVKTKKLTVKDLKTGKQKKVSLDKI